MMKRLLPLLVAFLAPCAGAATIRGVVLEAQSGSPLARARVSITPVPGTQGNPISVTTNRSGSFDATQLFPGMYTITASREGFVTAEYGQKRWNSAGLPVIVADNEQAFLDIRLQRYGAITGAVVDEQDVGVLGHEVVAYRATTPPVLIGNAVTDDHGMYRITGLEPGTYVVRNKPVALDDLTFLPTFAKDAAEYPEARRVQVDLDRASPSSDLRPAQGRLIRVSGDVRGTGKPPYKVTFVTDMGRLTIETGLTFQFPAVPPGNYELYAEGPGDGTSYKEGAYLPLALDKEYPIVLKMSPMRDVSIRVLTERGMPIDNVSVLARRVDLAGTGPSQLLNGREIRNGNVQLAPGRWEVMAMPQSGYYVSSFSSSRQRSGANIRPDGWNPLTVESYTQASFRLSANPAGVRGTVKLGNEGVPAAPVYLEPYDTATQQRLWEPKAFRADLQGRFQITGLGPGTYRILSTFEYSKPPAEVFDIASRTIVVEAGRQLPQDLDLWGIR